AALRLPEETLADHELGQAGAVLALGDVGELLAEGLVARIGRRFRHRHGERLVRLDRRLRGSLRFGWPLRLGLRRPGWRQLVALLRGGRNGEQGSGQDEKGAAGQKERHGMFSERTPNKVKYQA